MRIILTIVGLLYFSYTSGWAQSNEIVEFSASKNMLVVLGDTTFITHSDTVFYIPREDFYKVKIKDNPYAQSERFYDSLRSRASERKFTKKILSVFVKKAKGKAKISGAIIKSEDKFKPYSGYTIGTITFKNVDMLEGSVIDTSLKASSQLGVFINKIHIDTRASVVKRNLLFKSGDKVNPYVFADNERILRQFRTLRDSRILLKVVDKKNKIVDVVVVTQDVSSVGVAGGFSSFNSFLFELYHINILGFAKQLQVSYFRNTDESPINGYSVIFRAPNIRKTFVQGEAQFTQNYIRTQARLSLARDFLTPQTKYAGGIELFSTKEKFFFEDTDTLEISYQENSLDAWLGRSFELQERVNLITSLRIHKRDFFNKPFVSADSNSFFFDRTLFLGSVALIERNYLKSSLIRGYGRTEDVPIGGNITMFLGTEATEFFDRRYTELRTNSGKYIPDYGYFGGTLSLGTFFKQKKAEDGLLTINASYFSDLFRVKRMQSRQFINTFYTKGINRVLDKNLSIKGNWQDVDALAPLGSERLQLQVENVYFMPWYAYGFRFAFYHKESLIFLSDDDKLFEKRDCFFSVGAGIRVLNENFVFPTFLLDLNYFVGNKTYYSDFEIKFSTDLKRLFGNDQAFKPAVAAFQ